MLRSPLWTESRIPIIRDRKWAEFVQLVPFVDFDKGWNQTLAMPDPTNLTSIGLGVRWAAALSAIVQLHAQFELFSGLKLKMLRPGGICKTKGRTSKLVLRLSEQDSSFLWRHPSKRRARRAEHFVAASGAATGEIIADTGQGGNIIIFAAGSVSIVLLMVVVLEPKPVAMDVGAMSW